MNKLISILYSTRTMAVLLVVYALSMAVATFMENDYGTATAKGIIYESKWFELVQFLLIINFLGNIARYKLWRKEKWPVLVFHLSFALIFIGGSISRYVSFEGLMPIRENASSDVIYSDKVYLTAVINDDKVQKKYLRACNQPQFWWDFNEDYTFLDKKVNIELLDFVPNAKSEFIEDEKGVETLKIVSTDGKSRQTFYLKKGQNKMINNMLVTFSYPIQNALNIIEKDGVLQISSPLDYDYTVMKTQEKGNGVKETITPLKLRSLYNIEGNNFVFPQPVLKGIVKQTPARTNKEKETYHKDYLKLNVSSGGKSEEIEIMGAKYTTGFQGEVILNSLKVSLGYGSIEYKTPFKIHLRDFQLDKYPGSMSPSSFASEVTVLDPKAEKDSVDHRIFMNTVLDYKGYRFFQSSYDPDELGTRLSVNHDFWGTAITYLGYTLLFISMFITLFWKGTRFSILKKSLNKIAKQKQTLLWAAILFSFGLNAQNAPKPNVIHNIEEVLIQQDIKDEHVEEFSKTLVQDYQGRIKPIHTLSLELLRKIYKKDNFHGMSAQEVFLNSQRDPQTWSRMPMIVIGGSQTPANVIQEIKKKLGIENRKGNYASVVDFFDNNIQNILQEDVDKAKNRRDADKNAYDKEIVQLDERLWISWSILNKSFLKVFPKKGDANSTWFAPTDLEARFTGIDSLVLRGSFDIYKASLQDAMSNKNYVMADSMLLMINTYQSKMSNPEVLISEDKVAVEIFYNKQNIFLKVMMVYFLLGAILLVLCFLELFYDYKWVRTTSNILVVLISLTIFVQAGGLAMRWYITGHAPWSNGYESVVFISWVTMIAGLLFTRRDNRFALASTTLFAPFLLAIAHGSLMSPEITPLVPVLKSYWLMIHVAIITSSYGFFGLGALLGFINLFLLIMRTPKNASKINTSLKELTIINEMTLTIGIFALTIGTFLGGIWANESWGRYWSWDPKEVWAWISVMVYAFVLHMRLIPKLNNPFSFNFASMLALSSIIMTYFGVNYYLSGMHSYGKGDAVPIPDWIYYSLVFIGIFSFTAYLRYKKYKKK